MIGIYKITNKLNKKVYIGQSIDLKQRIASHQKSLENSYIDLAIREDGVENFEFEILEECCLKELNRKEKYYINKYNSTQEGYNRKKGSSKDKVLPAQKLYIINKKIEEGDIFIMLRWEEYCAAAKELSPSALNLYMYLAKNKNGYEFFFSSKDYCETFGVVDKTYRNARAELINKGYLKEGERNKVHFSSAAAFKETKESLADELSRLAQILKVQDESLYYDLCQKLEKVNLKQIQDENLYKVEIKKMIIFVENLLKEFARKEIEDLI